MTSDGGVPSAAASCCCSSSPRAERAEIGTEEELVARVAELRGDPAGVAELEGLLAESHPVYAGRGRAAVVRMRGWLLLALGEIEGGLRESSLPFVLEELESAHDAYLTAAAGHALRRFPERRADFVPPLAAALLYLRQRDDAVSLVEYGGYGVGGEKTTAVGEVLGAFRWLGAVARPALPRLRELRAEAGLTRAVAERVNRAVRAIDPGDDGLSRAAVTSSCCAVESVAVAAGTPPSAEIEDLELQDQNGERLTFGEFFHGRPAIVVFFYTRCDNPTKCQLTVTRLGRVQRLLRAEGLARRIRSAAITYDPRFDRPERLARYAATWGVEPDADHRMLRTVGGIGPLRAYFDLGVNYVSSVVNRHQIEAFVLDAEGRVRGAARRRQWDEREIVDRARALLR